jgi:C4-dicarboxylate transporter DctM subunit
VSGVLIYLSILFIKDTIDYEQISPAMQIPMYLPYIAMPVGLGLAVVHFVHDIVKLLAAGHDPASIESAAAAPLAAPPVEVLP